MDVNYYFGIFWYVAVFFCALAAYRCNNIYNRLFGYMFIFVTLFVDFLYSQLSQNYPADKIDILKFNISYFLSIAVMFVCLSFITVFLSKIMARNGHVDDKNHKNRYLNLFFVGSILLITAPIESIFECFYSFKDYLNISKSFIDFLYICAIYDWMIIISTSYYFYCFYEIFKSGDKGCDRISAFSALFGGNIDSSYAYFGIDKIRKK